MSKPKWKLVTNYDVLEYRCGARAGDHVRLRNDIIVRDHDDRPTGEVHNTGEIWTVLPGAKGDPGAVWLRQADGDRCTWSDDDKFWEQFEIVE
jgi:hypothetical protein